MTSFSEKFQKFCRDLDGEPAKLPPMRKANLKLYNVKKTFAGVSKTVAFSLTITEAELFVRNARAKIRRVDDEEGAAFEATQFVIVEQ